MSLLKMDSEIKTKTPFPQFIQPEPNTHLNWALFLIIALGITGGLLITIQNFKTQEDIDSTALNNPRLRPLKANADSEIDAWKTYRNEEYGFEFKYPSGLYELKKDWALFTIQNTPLPLELGGMLPPNYAGKVNNKDFVTQGFSYYLEISEASKLNLRENETGTIKTNLNFSNFNALRYDYVNQVSRGPVVVISLKNDNKKVLIFGYQSLCFETCNDDLVENIFNKILSTFKFTQTPSGTGKTE